MRTSPHPIVWTCILVFAIRYLSFFKNVSRDSTVSTLFNISRKNFEDAPKARRIVTPEIVSP